MSETDEQIKLIGLERFVVLGVIIELILGSQEICLIVISVA